jgi:hypothetical protein
LHENKQAAVEAACFGCHLKKPPPYLLFLAITCYQPRSKDKTLCGNWLACANMALPACDKICERDKLEVSIAKSASMIRLRAAAWFSVLICK